MDFTSLKPNTKTEVLIDPYEIFRRNVSKMGSSGINDLWAGQRDALREWHNVRNEKDIALVLNTGAGKTLIGLLIAQSIVNETRGKVFYLCGSIQLIEQTREKAESYGIDVTTYHGNQFNNTLFEQGKSVCITTYQALFNGKSKFINSEIEAILFDDSHAAENLVKNCFSLEINRNQHEQLFNQLIEVFRPYYQKVGKQGSFDEIFTGQNTKIAFFPPFEVRENQAVIRSILEAANVATNSDTLFAWNHLKDHIELCSYFVSSRSIQITPPFIPVSSLPYFSNQVRRIYLTATIIGEDNFIRTFGREPDKIIIPQTPAGECERQILFPALTENITDDRSATEALTNDHKTLIITPNSFIAEQWSSVAKIPLSVDMHQEITSFKQSENSDKIVITARYDGIDLPGDTCRVLVMHGLPMGAALIDRYYWESLRLSNTLRSLIACRVVQSLGRISRGMSDYGAVIICGREYVSWLQNPRNQGFLPPFIQRQLQLGLQISEKSAGIDDIRLAMSSCFSRSDNWLQGYNQFMASCEIDITEENNDVLKGLAKAEMAFIEKYWQRDFNNAAKQLIKCLDDAMSVNTGLAAWYACWIGNCCELTGDTDTASLYYKKANSLNKDTPRYLSSSSANAGAFSDQILNISNNLLISSGSQIAAPKTIVTDLKYLDHSGSVNQTEEALKQLGSYLGFEATRPDKEHAAGPDVLWIDSGIALAIEAKTEKSSDYNKDEIGQLLNHIQWVKDNYPEISNIIPLFVGPITAATNSSSPSDEIMVARLDTFKSLSDKLIAVYDDLALKAMPISLNQDVSEAVINRELEFTKCVKTIGPIQLKAL